MEKDFGSWFIHQRTRSPNLNSSAPFNFGAENIVPAYADPCNNMFSTNETLPAFAFSHSKPCQPIEPRGWSYCLPRFRQAFSPVPNCAPSEKLNTSLIENPKGEKVSSMGPGLGQKRFLVFDQSGDRTTFVFSSGLGGRVQYPPWNPLIPPSNLKAEREKFRPTELFFSDEYNEENVRNEMEENSEEIDALLYSDDDDNEYSEEDDEVTSTGHSPSTVTAHHGKEGWAEESEGEVGPVKRRKVSDVGYSVPSLMDTACSVKSSRCFEYEDDAESSCGESKDQVLRELSGKKRSRKEKIRDTLSVLESIIPSGNDNAKDAIGVIDEAIRYLGSLKAKAKALGFDSLEDAYYL